MASIHGRSDVCLNTELDIFKAPATQISAEVGDWHEYLPSAAVTDNGPIEFYISGSGNEYIDLMHTRLYLKACIVNANGTRLDDNLKVTPINNWLSSLFSQVEVTLNGRTVGHSNVLYPYRAIIEILMNYGSHAEKGHLQSSLFYKDSSGSMDKCDPTEVNFIDYIPNFHTRGPVALPTDEEQQGLIDNIVGEGGQDPNLAAASFNQFIEIAEQLNQAGGNHGLFQRWCSSRGSKWVELEGPLHADIFQQEKYLANSIDLGIKLMRQRPEFCLMTDIQQQFKVQIADASLFIRKVTLTDSVFLAHQHALLNANAIYPLNYVTMKSFSIPAGNRSGPQDNIFLGTLPQEMIVCFVDNDAMLGNYTKNPFNFKHMNIRYMSCKYGNRIVPAKPYTFNFTGDTKQYIRAYNQLQTASGRYLKDAGSMIQREDFGRGYALFAFDFRPDIDSKGCYSLKQSGSVQLNVEFAEALHQTINMIVYGAFDSYLEVTSSREIITV